MLLQKKGFTESEKKDFKKRTEILKKESLILKEAKLKKAPILEEISRNITLQYKEMKN